MKRIMLLLWISITLYGSHKLYSAEADSVKSQSPRIYLSLSGGAVEYCSLSLGCRIADNASVEIFYAALIINGPFAYGPPAESGAGVRFRYLFSDNLGSFVNQASYSMALYDKVNRDGTGLYYPMGHGMVLSIANLTLVREGYLLIMILGWRTHMSGPNQFQADLFLKLA